MTQADPVPVRVGDLLEGKYRVEAVLGMGGMGVVVAARHEQLDQRVAIKFVRPDALGNGEAVERFLREARAAVKLKSEHAARVIDVGTLESGAPYMVMELLEGTDLARALEERGRLSVEQAADWIVQACEALAEAHAAGIVHRDLKPQNLFLARTVGDAVKVKVLDFGVSKSNSAISRGEGGLTHTRTMLGSPLYMSPEQMRSSRNVDARADVWALGVVLFELLTNTLPFEAETLPELCLKVVSDPPRSLPDLRPELPPQLCGVVERCLSKNPAERFANAGELAEALEPFASPASRETIQRAGSVARGGGFQLASSEPGAAGLGALAALGSQPQSRQRTPAAWGSGRSSRRRSQRRMHIWVVTGLAALALAGGALVLARRDRGPSAADSPPPSALAPAAAVTAAATSSASAAPPPTAVAPLAEPPLALPAHPVANEAGAPSPIAPLPSAKPSAPRASPQPKATDDDIPAVR